MLEKQVVIDRIEILEDGTMQIRTATRILEDGKIISQSLHRHVVTPNKVDMTDQHPRVKAVASTLWTKDVKDAYAAKLVTSAPQIEAANEEVITQPEVPNEEVIIPPVEEVTEEVIIQPEVPNDPEIMP